MRFIRSVFQKKRKDGTETLEERVARVVTEEVEFVDYDPIWPIRFEEEKKHLLDCLPAELTRRNSKPPED
ncbi:hypothetical protein SAMN04489760_13817 [Syntrophus gentianae]|uniref:Uncharacterized protein n=1 Tax=Syntrophus gentianae TaxID=43775 RepID=A0A1H8ALY3_9BACT|nr:hypothetical protein [Syntrophus gentianae]SEM71740.1 hypothetical protein SAMN04489760_13817 [Syntrophus gentianae]